MSTSVNGLTVRDARSASPDSLLDHASSLPALTKGEPTGELGMDDGTNVSGHSLLSRPSLPQGRRSLFRR
jgi:hypothetical protein